MYCTTVNLIVLALLSLPVQSTSASFYTRLQKTGLSDFINFNILSELIAYLYEQGDSSVFIRPSSRAEIS